jgi:hypothetical protein
VFKEIPLFHIDAAYLSRFALANLEVGRAIDSNWIPNLPWDF